MKISTVINTDPFLSRKCQICKRLIKVNQLVFSYFYNHRSYGGWLVFHALCVDGPDSFSKYTHNEVTSVLSDSEKRYQLMREQILMTKEAFPDAAA